MKAKWHLGLYASLVLLVSACSTDSTATTSPDTSTSAPTTTVSVATTTTATVTEQDRDEAVEVVRQLLEAVLAKDQTATVELVDVPEGRDSTTEQIRNMFRFDIATGWLDEVGHCSAEQSESEPAVVVACSVFSWHPLFGFPDEERVWDLQVQDDVVIGADLGPYSKESVERFLEWLNNERSTLTDLMCGSDAYEASEALRDVTAYPLHPRCGSYLTEQTGAYFLATQPDHPLAVWQRFEDAWNERQFDEVRSVFADEAVLVTEQSGTYRGWDEISEWVEYEFENFTDSVTYFEDYRIDGSTLQMISSWTTPSGDRTGFRPDFALVENGLIQRIVFGEAPLG